MVEKALAKRVLGPTLNNNNNNNNNNKSWKKQTNKQTDNTCVRVRVVWTSLSKGCEQILIFFVGSHFSYSTVMNVGTVCYDLVGM